MPKEIDSFVNYSLLKWSRNLKSELKRGKMLEFNPSNIRTGLYRPFVKQYLYFAPVVIDERGQLAHFFPEKIAELENRVICISDVGYRSTFSVLATNVLPDHHLCATTDIFQTFPYFVYDEDGTNRRENITDWALAQFRSHYEDATITKWDIFHYVYALLHHPAYRSTYGANLKRDLPHIPFVFDFWALARAGDKLTDLHVNYESQPEYNLKMVENPELPLDWRVERMRLSKDKTHIVYNDFLILAGVPKETFDYRLGNRSALDWVIEQYRVKIDTRTGVTSDPNRVDEPDYIVRLVKQIITVSVETVKLVKSLPALKVENVAAPISFREMS
jgi:predicted helicase